MQAIERIPTLEPRKPIDLSRVLLETVIAIVGALLVTGIIYFFHLYPLIPNISFLYLLVVLGLASSFGLYAAIVASLTAFLSFDYFLVPPLYVFTINRWEEWVALFIFLLTALLTSQLTVVLRERTALARRRERESKILYELIRLANSQELFEEQLGIVVESIVRVFAAWGVRDCALLLPELRFLRRMINTGLVIGLAARQERDCKQSKQIAFHRFVKTTGSPTDTRAKFSGPLDKNSAVQLFLSTETTLSSLMVSLFFSTFR